jgi:hypothetical protein
VLVREAWQATDPKTPKTPPAPAALEGARPGEGAGSSDGLIPVAPDAREHGS